MVWRLRRRKRASTSPRIRLLELAVSARYAASRLGLLANRVRRAYMRTNDPSLEEMLRKLLALQAVFEIMAVRLETLAEVRAVTSDTLGLVQRIVNDAKSAYGELGPSVTSILSEIENMVASLAAESGIELSIDEEIPGSRISEEAKRILEEAQVVAEERLREITQQGSTSG